MSTLTATPDPASGTVRLVISDASKFIGIDRADHNGTRPVRKRSDQASKPGVLEIVDYEPSLSGLIQYTLVELGGSLAAPAWTSLSGLSELPRFILPSIPQFSVTVDTVHGYSAARRSRSTFHTVINRNDPIVAEGRLTPRTGSLDVWLGEYMDAKNLDNMFERGQVVLYRQAEHPGMDMYFHAADVSLAPDEDSWRLSLGYVEVDFPPGDVLSGENWTFDAVASGHANFNTVAQQYHSFHDLTIGQKDVGE